MKKFVFLITIATLFFSCVSTPKVDTETYNNLYNAVSAGNYDSVNSILNGTDKQVVKRVINKKDKQGNTLLILAVKKAQLNITRALLNAGADKTVKDKKGKTAEDYAWEAKAADILALLTGKAVSSSLPAATGNARTYEEIEQQGGKPVTDSQLEFIRALDNNNVGAVREWISSGTIDMYMNVPGSGSQAAIPILLYAINKNLSFSVISEIVDYYTEPLDEIVDREGRNAWYYATLRKNQQVQRLLQQKGISTDNAVNSQR